MSQAAPARHGDSGRKAVAIAKDETSIIKATRIGEGVAFREYNISVSLAKTERAV